MEQLQMSLLVAQLAKEQATARELMSRAMKAESEIGVDAAKVEMGLMQQRIDALDALLGRAFEIVKFEKEVEAGERQTTFQETKTIADMLMRTGV
jgi:NAD/NADP transhydrogenase beta subunit